MYWFSVTAVSNNRTWGGLKQHKLVIYCSREVQHTGLKSRCGQSHIPLWREALGESLSLPSQLLATATFLGSWTPSPLPPPSRPTTVSLAILQQFLHLNVFNLITSAMSLFPRKVIFTNSGDQGPNVSGRSIICLPQQAPEFFKGQKMKWEKSRRKENI